MIAQSHLATLLLLFGTSPLAARAATAAACVNLTSLTIPTVTITSAVVVPAGKFEVPGSTQALNLPEFCRAVAAARPTPDSDIAFEVWIPTTTWNGRFEGVGTGGFSGEISYAAMAAALKSGYATASTDTGHRGDALIFGNGHPEKIDDWAYRAMHLMTEAAKLIVRDDTGRLPERSYFNGCATGGHQSMMEVLRYPDDYDGVIAGDPAADRVHEIEGYLAVWKSTHDAAGHSLLSSEKLHMITRAALAKCDALDGVADGVINDPKACRFDPADLACKGAETASCLTAAEVAAAKKVYTGTRNPRTGVLIFPGWPVGSEGWGDTPNGGWDQMVNTPAPRRVDFFKYFVFDDPDWNFDSFDFDRDAAYSDQKMGFLAATGTDISPFAAHGGKLLMYTGLVDPILPADDVIDYYRAITRRMGGPEKSKAIVRFFEVPGMGHCSGGPGATHFDMMPVLQAWVEQDKAPEQVIASRMVEGKTVRTRPLCLYPRMAEWTGKGSTDDAANFRCVTPLIPQNP